jgi:hypothetical protein
MTVRHALLPLMALFVIGLAAAPAAARGPDRGDAAPAAVRQGPDTSRLIAAGGVVALGLASLGAVAVISRRQRGYLERR